jgi:hypothetical protein
VNDFERDVSQSHAYNDNEGTENQVEGKLELNEFPNVVKYSSSPSNGSVDAFKLIVENDQIRVVFSDLASSSHAQANISLS